MAFALLAPTASIRSLALAMCIKKNCWLKDLRGVSIDELYEQAEMIKAENQNG